MKKIVLRYAMAILVVLLIVYIVLVLRSPKLTVSFYEVEADIPAPLRIVQLSDLHSTEYGEKNRDLVALTAAQEPDLIVLTGDMFSRFDEDYHVAAELVPQLAEIAPVYYGLGNHEMSWQYGEYASLREVFADLGAVVLDCDFVDVEIKGVDLRIGGFYGFYGLTHMHGETEERKIQEQQFYDSFPVTDRYKILLDHIPTQWLDWHHLDEMGQDLILCGHYHGGQIRIPGLNRGIIAPNVGLFPEYTKGCFTGASATCVLSAGLGNEYAMIPRVNNPPEIVVVDLVATDNEPV